MCFIFYVRCIRIFEYYCILYLNNVFIICKINAVIKTLNSYKIIWFNLSLLLKK